MKFTASIQSIGFPSIETKHNPPKNIADGEATNSNMNYMYAWAGSALMPTGNLQLSPCPPGILDTYRWMDNHPTLSLAKGVVTVPVVGAPYSFEADKSVPDKYLEVIQRAIKPLLHQLIYDMIDALSFRWQPFEIVWGYDQDKWHVPVKFKPLAQEYTCPLIHKNSKQFVGVRNFDEDLLGPKSFVYAESPRYGTVIGKCRHEAARESAWWPWMEALKMSGKLDKKASGIVFAVKGPTHQQFRDSAGNMITGQAAALNLANMLQQGISVYMPNRLVTATTVDQLKDLAKVSDFDVEYFDLGDTGPANRSLLDKMRYCDSGMFRSWKRPERSALEGQKGTLAEAEAHGDIGMGDSEMLRTFISNAINAGVIDAVAVENWGEQYRGKIRLKPAPVTEGRFVVLKLLLDRIAQYPEMLTAIVQNTDMDSVFDVLGVPKREQIIDMSKVKIETPVAGQSSESGNNDPNKTKGNGNGKGKSEK